jgi:2,3-bisphosphoglycerate-independent phosphoglycerate mutase
LKYLILIPDGMADWDIPALGNMTPLRAAKTEWMDKLCRISSTGQLQTIPDGMPAGSEIANLSILGYDPFEVYQGRGVLEAASMGIEIMSSDLVMRCNLICLNADGTVKNHSAGHISTEEAIKIIDSLNKEIGKGRSAIYPGVSYRHVYILENGNGEILCTPPHDVPGIHFKDVLVKPASHQAEKTAAILNDLILRSQTILKDHPVNVGRIKAGKDPANSIWFWSAGHKPKMRSFKEAHHLTGAVISAVDLINGMCKLAGFNVIHVEGATGLYDTNYEGKVLSALEALQKNDLVYLHIEAPDEAGHEGDPILKIRAIEDIDLKVVKVLVSEVEKRDDLVLAILPDHATPIETRTHTNEPVPFLIYYPGEAPDDVVEFNETSVQKGKHGLLKGDEFIKLLLGERR